MANLNDTLVNGDLRVVGNIYGTVTSALSAGSTSITTGSTAGITLTAGQKFTLAAGGSSAAFTMPSAPTAVGYASSAGSATKLTSSRNVITNLGSNTAASFNGTADISAGVTGTLAIKNGGTGATAASAARANLEITPANIGAATSTHTHGNITSGGTITADTTTASGDKLVIIDADNNKVARSNIAFDGSTTTQALSKKGTWETFSKLTLGTGASNAASGNHTHTAALASGSTVGTSLAYGTKYTLTAGGSTVSFTMPSNPNTDVKVNQNIKTDNAEYPILTKATTATATTAAESNFAAGVTINPSTSAVKADTMIAKFVTPNNTYGYNSDYGIRLCNSDIVEANSIYFADTCDNQAEGIHFLRSGTTGYNAISAAYWDSIWCTAGYLYFTPSAQCNNSTSIDSAHSKKIAILPSAYSNNL